MAESQVKCPVASKKVPASPILRGTGQTGFHFPRRVRRPDFILNAAFGAVILPETVHICKQLDKLYH